MIQNRLEDFHETLPGIGRWMDCTFFLFVFCILLLFLFKKGEFVPTDLKSIYVCMYMFEVFFSLWNFLESQNV